jgi:hypothetical protein
MGGRAAKYKCTLIRAKNAVPTRRFAINAAEQAMMYQLACSRRKKMRSSTTPSTVAF